MQYNAIIEFEIRHDTLTEDAVDEWIDELVGFHPAISGSDDGRAELVVTVDAAGVRQAAATVLELAGGREVRALRILPTAEFDALVGPGGRGL